MTAKTKRSKTDVPSRDSRRKHASARDDGDGFRSSLVAYIIKPDSFPPGTIIRQTEHTVLIRDLYPKALVHLLLLPRHQEYYSLDPIEAFNSPSAKQTAFLSLMKTEAVSAARLAASELSRLVSPWSAGCKARNEALDADNAPDELPPGRDFAQDIKIGVHAQPSMSTLHVHIISVDNYSVSLKHKKHYNSFNTNFFIPLDDFPLPENDIRLEKDNQSSQLKGDMKCWRCGKNFGNKFKQLKEHLNEEYEEWRKV